MTTGNCSESRTHPHRCGNLKYRRCFTTRGTVDLRTAFGGLLTVTLQIDGEFADGALGALGFALSAPERGQVIEDNRTG